jgi:hypothetical protein
MAGAKDQPPRRQEDGGSGETWASGWNCTCRLDLLVDTKLTRNLKPTDAPAPTHFVQPPRRQGRQEDGGSGETWPSGWNCTCRLDLLVGAGLIVVLKATEAPAPTHIALVIRKRVVAPPWRSWRLGGSIPMPSRMTMTESNPRGRFIGGWDRSWTLPTP